ncbi:hypothetical protein B7463_g11369, partial [Scytalidium lignicola]
MPPFFFEQSFEPTQLTFTTSWNDPTTVETRRQTTASTQQIKEPGALNTASKSRDLVISYFDIVDLFRVMPAERAFLFEEIRAKAATDLRAPSRNSKTCSENEYINYFSSESPGSNSLSTIVLADNTSQRCASLDTATTNQHPYHSSGRTKTEINNKEDCTHVDRFRDFHDLWGPWLEGLWMQRSDAERSQRYGDVVTIEA